MLYIIIKLIYNNKIKKNKKKAILTTNFGFFSKKLFLFSYILLNFNY